MFLEIIVEVEGMPIFLLNSPTRKHLALETQLKGVLCITNSDGITPDEGSRVSTSRTLPFFGNDVCGEARRLPEAGTLVESGGSGGCGGTQEGRDEDASE